MYHDIRDGILYGVVIGGTSQHFDESSERGV